MIQKATFQVSTNQFSIYLFQKLHSKKFNVLSMSALNVELLVGNNSKQRVENVLATLGSWCHVVRVNISPTSLRQATKTSSPYRRL